MTRLATLVIARPRRVLAPAVFFLVAAGVFGGPVAGLLSTGDDFNDPGAESVAADERLAPAPGADSDGEVVVPVEPARRAAGAAAKLRPEERRVGHVRRRRRRRRHLMHCI